MKRTISISMTALLCLFLASCTSFNRKMKEPNVLVELYKSDFTLSGQVSAEAKSTTIVGIDFARMFSKNTGTVESAGGGFNFASIPVVGSLLQEPTVGYALHDLMEANPGYDVVFYPQYEVKVVKPILGIGFLTKVVEVKTIARLGKLKN